MLVPQTLYSNKERANVIYWDKELIIVVFRLQWQLMAEQSPSSDWIKNGTHQSVDAGGGEDGDLSDMNVVKGVSWGVDSITQESDRARIVEDDWPRKTADKKMMGIE